jgi:hypothetical protein
MRHTVALVKVTESEILSAKNNDTFSFPERPRQINKGDLILLSEH